METTNPSLEAKDIKKELKNNKDVILIDTLSKESFCAKHIPGSINIPTAKIKDVAPTILPDKTQKLIVYCVNSDCKKSIKATEILTKEGYTNVVHYADGLEGWLREGYKLEGNGQNITDECG